MAASATVGRAIRARRVAPANGRLGASDYPVSIGQCPVCTGQCPARQRLQFCNGRLCHFRKEIRTGP
jgi:heterodisulfide reductase subunit C